MPVGQDAGYNLRADGVVVVLLVQLLLQSLVSFTLHYWTLFPVTVARIFRGEDVVDSKKPPLMPGFAPHGGCWRYKPRCRALCYCYGQ